MPGCRGKGFPAVPEVSASASIGTSILFLVPAFPPSEGLPTPISSVTLSLCTAAYLGGDRLDNSKHAPNPPPPPGQT